MPRFRSVRIVLTSALAVLWAGAGMAEDAVTLTDPTAFEHAYATSFYGFDGCGAQLTGEMFRDALAEKFATCPFSAEARSRYQHWTAAQRAKSVDAIKAMIVEHGGLPQRLRGMTETCHAQTTSDAFQKLRRALEGYEAGQVSAAAILPGPCDAAEIVP